MYELLVTAPNGCTNTDQSVVEADTVRPVIDLSAGVLTCRDSLAHILAFIIPDDAGLIWTGPQPGLPGNNDLIVETPGTYQLEATGSNGCTATSEVEVEEILPDWYIEIGPDTTVLQGTWITVYADSDLPPADLASRYWIPNFGCFQCDRQVFQVNESFLFQIEVEDKNGCIQTDSRQINIIPNGIYIPNIFSPNGDGESDFFQVFAAEGVDLIKQFKVFDRWGDLVFYQENYKPGDFNGAWDGTFGGQDRTPDVFVWQVEVVMIDGTILYLQGDVTLIR
jgi:gliding motility-associated-like protein